MHEGAEPTHSDGGTRRDFIRRVSVGAAVLAASGGVPAVARGEAMPTATSAVVPKRGGTLRAAFSGGSATDTVDGDNVINNLDFARTYPLYDGLVRYDATGAIVNSLAQEITSNKNATVWTCLLYTSDAADE